MKFFQKVFQKKKKFQVPPIPSWEAVVEMMHDKYLDAFSGEVIQVIYSKDRSMRYVILKDEKGLLTYQLEAIYQYDEDDWQFICLNNSALPAMWEPYKGVYGKSLFNDHDDLLKELKTEPEYLLYF